MSGFKPLVDAAIEARFEHTTEDYSLEDNPCRYDCDGNGGDGQPL